ncbi:unnamed protein product, partial [Closterium sp. NIES-65]
ISAGARSTSPTSTSLRRRRQDHKRHSQSSSSSATALFRTGQTPAGDWQGAATSTTKWRCRAAVPHQAAGSRNRGSAEDESDIDGLAEESAVLRITNHHVDMDLSADDTETGDSVRAVAWSDDSGLLVVEADDGSEIKSNGRGGERAVNGNALGRDSGRQKIAAKEEEGMGEGEEELGVASELPIPILSSAEEPKRPYEFKILKEELKFSRYLNVFNRVVEHPPQPLPNGQTLPASMTRPASDEHPVGGDCLLAEEFGVIEERPANSSGHSGGWIGYGLEPGQGEQRAELWPQQVVEYDVVAAKTKSCHFVCVLPFHSKTQTVTLLKEYAQVRGGTSGRVLPQAHRERNLWNTQCLSLPPFVFLILPVSLSPSISSPSSTRLPPPSFRPLPPPVPHWHASDCFCPSPLPFPPSPSVSLPLPPSPSHSLPLPPSPSLSFPLPPSHSLSFPLLPSPSLTFPHLPSLFLSFPLLLVPACSGDLHMCFEMSHNLLPLLTSTSPSTSPLRGPQGANALVYTVPCGGYTDNHTSLEDCARRELSEEAKLCGGQLIKLVGDDHPGLLEVSRPAFPRSSVSSCSTRCALLALSAKHRRDDLGGLDDLTRTTPTLSTGSRGVHNGSPRASGVPALTHSLSLPCRFPHSPFSTPQDDSDPLPRDLEEFIEVHRVPVGDLQGMALSGDMLLPSVVTCTMALQYLKDNGWL